MNSIVIKNLYEFPELVPVVAQWIYQQFWTHQNEVTLSILEEKLKEAVHSDLIPLSLVAFNGGTPVGTINLIQSDDDSRPHLSPWLAALVVKKEHQGRGIGSMLIQELLSAAKTMSIKKVYLGTEIPDYYRRLGAEVYEVVRPNFYIMCF